MNTALLFLVIGFQSPAKPPGDAAFAVLQANCLACHDRKLHSGKLVMETIEDLLRGGAHGPAVVPGRSAESRLLLRVTGEEKPKMPLEGELKPAEIEVLRAWIDAGARAWGAAAADAPLTVPDVKPAAPVAAPVNALAYSPDGRLLAAAGYREMRLLDASTQHVRKVLTGSTDMVRALAFSPDGRVAAGAGGAPSRYGEIVLWDVSTGEVLRRIQGHKDYVYGLAFSPDGKLLASSSYDRLVKIWDAATGTEVRTLKEHTDAVFPIAFSPDGRRLASGGADRTVKIWDVETGRRLYTLSDAADVITTLAFHPSGKMLSASGGDKHIRTWRLEADGGVLQQSIIAHEAEVTRIAYFPDGDRLVSAAADRTVKIWNLRTGEMARVFPEQPDWVLGLAVSPDGAVVAVGRYDGTIARYETTGPAAVRDKASKSQEP
jgi:WD40 repeat protein